MKLWRLNMENTFKTKDFYFACALKSEGFELLDSEKKDKVIYFNFLVHDKLKLDSLLSDFLNMTLSVNMKKFTWAMADLRKYFNNKN